MKSSAIHKWININCCSVKNSTPSRWCLRCFVHHLSREMRHSELCDRYHIYMEPSGLWRRSSRKQSAVSEWATQSLKRTDFSFVEKLMSGEQRCLEFHRDNENIANVSFINRNRWEQLWMSFMSSSELFTGIEVVPRWEMTGAELIKMKKYLRCILPFFDQCLFWFDFKLDRRNENYRKDLFGILLNTSEFHGLIELSHICPSMNFNFILIILSIPIIQSIMSQAIIQFHKPLYLYITVRFIWPRYHKTWR